MPNFLLVWGPSQVLTVAFEENICLNQMCKCGYVQACIIKKNYGLQVSNHDFLMLSVQLHVVDSYK